MATHHMVTVVALPPLPPSVVALPPLPPSVVAMVAERVEEVVVTVVETTHHEIHRLYHFLLHHDEIKFQPHQPPEIFNHDIIFR